MIIFVEGKELHLYPNRDGRFELHNAFQDGKEIPWQGCSQHDGLEELGRSVLRKVLPPYVHKQPNATDAYTGQTLQLLRVEGQDGILKLPNSEVAIHLGRLQELQG